MSTSQETNGTLAHPARRPLIALVAIVAGSLLAALAAAPAAHADSGDHPSGPAVLTGSGKLTTPGPAAASGVVKQQSIVSAQTVYWNWQNANSGRCLGVAGGNMANGTPIVQWDCYGTDHPDQYWSAVPINDGYYYQFKNLSNPNKCLGVPGGSTNAGAQLVIWDCYGTDHPDQYWTVISASRLNPNDSGYVIINANSHMVIGVGASRTDNGAAVVQWPWVDHADQRWF